MLHPARAGRVGEERRSRDESTSFLRRPFLGSASSSRIHVTTFSLQPGDQMETDQRSFRPRSGVTLPPMDARVSPIRVDVDASTERVELTLDGYDTVGRRSIPFLLPPVPAGSPLAV